MTLPLSPMVKLACKKRSEATCSSLPVICRRNQEGYQDQHRRWLVISLCLLSRSPSLLNMMLHLPARRTQTNECTTSPNPTCNNAQRKRKSAKRMAQRRNNLQWERCTTRWRMQRTKAKRKWPLPCPSPPSCRHTMGPKTKVATRKQCLHNCKCRSTRHSPGSNLHLWLQRRQRLNPGKSPMLMLLPPRRKPNLLL